MQTFLKKYRNKNVFITGGTGSYGQEFIKFCLDNKIFKKIIIYSRDEMKQWHLMEKYKNHLNKLEFVIGDVRDRERLYNSLNNVDYVFHAAATKIVPTAEENPIECIKTNILGASNVIDASKTAKVKKVIALSTDKASSPINLYGATKLCSDKLFLTSNKFTKNSTLYSVVRYGNVIGSRGSVIPYFLSLPKNTKIPLTSERMTRFIIFLQDAIKFSFLALEKMQGGEIFVKKLPSVKIKHIAEVIRPNQKYRLTGIRAGEKLHEEMISMDEAINTYEFKDYFKIVSIPQKKILKQSVFGGKKVNSDFFYSSNQNGNYLKKTDIKKILKQIKSN